MLFAGWIGYQAISYYCTIIVEMKTSTSYGCLGLACKSFLITLICLFSFLIYLKYEISYYYYVFGSELISL